VEPCVSCLALEHDTLVDSSDVDAIQVLSVFSLFAQSISARRVLTALLRWTTSTHLNTSRPSISSRLVEIAIISRDLVVFCTSSSIVTSSRLAFTLSHSYALKSSTHYWTSIHFYTPLIQLLNSSPKSPYNALIMAHRLTPILADLHES
jgi:hypothetical protein